MAFLRTLTHSPGKLSYGSAGTGSATHLNMELFKSMAGVDIAHIPYKGSTFARMDTVGGQVQLAMDGLLPVLPLLASLSPALVPVVSPADMQPSAPSSSTSPAAGTGRRGSSTGMTKGALSDWPAVGAQLCVSVSV